MKVGNTNSKNSNFTLYWDSWKNHIPVLESEDKCIIFTNTNISKDELGGLNDLIERTNNNTIVDVEFDFSKLSDFDFIIANNNFNVHNIPENIRLEFERVGFDKYC